MARLVMARRVRRALWSGVPWAVAAGGVAAAVLTAGSGGCNGGPPSTQPATVEQRQAAALRDPMNYKQQVGTVDDDPSITHLDGGGLTRDLKDVFNP